MAGKQDSNEQKDHKPTARKLRKARAKGHVSQSRELTAAISLTVTACVVALMLPWAGATVARLWSAVLLLLRHPSNGQVLNLTFEAAGALATFSLTTLLIAAAVGALAARIQTGPVFSAEPMKPQLEHLNPVANAKRLFSMRTVVQLALLVAKALIIGVGVWLIFMGTLGDAVRMVLGGVGAGLAVFQKATLWLSVWGIVGFLMLAVLDLWYQRFQFNKEMSMSMREMRREHKEDEGDPIIKSARRRAGKEPMLQAQLQFVSMASIVIDSDEGRLIALYFAPRRLPKPVVVMRAAGELANTVRQIASEAQVPIVAHSALVQLLWPVATPNYSVPDGLAPEAVALIRRHNKRFAQ